MINNMKIFHIDASSYTVQQIVSGTKSKQFKGNVSWSDKMRKSRNGTF